jgi:anti-sigma-K factor RskA
MNYQRPELLERLAADYAIGAMPVRARRRFERAMMRDATVAAAVAGWTDRFAPLDGMTADEPPPGHVWRAIEQRIGTPDAPMATQVAAPAQSWFRALAFWRTVAASALAVCAALVAYIAVYPPPLPKVIAVLADKAGLPGWVALAGRSGEVAVASIGTPAAETGHSLQLWGVGGGTPRSLGLLPADPDQPIWLRAATLPAIGEALAVSVEPPGGSPTGLPTGPVIYQGKVLGAPR